VSAFGKDDATVAPSTKQSIELTDFHSATASPTQARGQIRSGHIAFGGDHTFTDRRSGRTPRDQNNQEEAWEESRFEGSPHRRPDKRYGLWTEALKSRRRASRSGDRGVGADMKFSHSIQFNAVPDWNAYYIAYDNLKKL
jgi:phosphate transporter